MPNILDSVKASYRGRLPSRADGKARRRKILDAVRQIIVRQGAQGVKHRAIADEAEVPLAATTYYFPDIHALLHDAFLDFCETNIHQLQALEKEGRTLLLSIGEFAALTEEDKQDVTQNLSQVILRHIQGQVASRDDRIIERAFRNESIRNQELAELVNAMELQQLQAIAAFFRALGTDDPDSDSRELMAIILFLEHSLLAGYTDEAQAKTTVERMFSRLLAG